MGDTRPRASSCRDRDRDTGVETRGPYLAEKAAKEVRSHCSMSFVFRRQLLFREAAQEALACCTS
jgi:hypothetical protein